MDACAHRAATAPESVESLIGSLAELNANLEMLEYMWGPSDFTVTGTLRSFDRTSDLGSLTMPVLFHCGEFDVPPESVESLIGSLVEQNANLEMLEYMWGPSDFTVTGTLRSFDRTSDLGTLTMPVLFHCGEFDEARPNTVREQAALTPNAEVAIIAGAGHLTMIDAPELANGAIRNFLARVEKEALSK